MQWFPPQRMGSLRFKVLALVLALPVFGKPLTSAEVSECAGKISYVMKPPSGAGFFLADCNGRWTNHYYVTAAHVWGPLSLHAAKHRLRLGLQMKAAGADATVGAPLGTDDIRYCHNLDIAYVQVYGSVYNHDVGRGYREVILDRKLLGKPSISLADLREDLCYLLPSNALVQCGMGEGTETLHFYMRAKEIKDGINLPPWTDGCRERRGQILEMAKMLRFDERTPLAPYYQVSNVVIGGDSGGPVFALLGDYPNYHYAVFGLVTGWKDVPIGETGIKARESWITASDYIIEALPVPSRENNMDAPSN